MGIADWLGMLADGSTQGFLSVLAMLLLAILLCVALCWASKGRAQANSQGYEQVVQIGGKTTSTQKIRAGPGRFLPAVQQLPEGTMIIINSLDPEKDTKGLPWLHVSFSTAGGEVLSGYLPQSAVEQVETAAP
jgi:uncharacterized protein YraI